MSATENVEIAALTFIAFAPFGFDEPDRYGAGSSR